MPDALLPRGGRSPAARGLPVAALLLGLILARGAPAEEITFDELPAANANCCFLSDEYAELGAFFETTDDGSVWDGMAAGDPGDWQVDGTRGQAFLGFNGRSYEATVHFDAPVVEFALDVTRAAGNIGFAEVRVWGLRDGEIIERQKQQLGAVNLWVTLSLESEVDAVRWKVLGDGDFRNYAVDHLRWQPAAPPEPELLEVGVEVLPFRRHKVLPDAHRGAVPMLLWGSADLHVADVDPGTLTCAEAPVLRGWLGPRYFDRNRDGHPDMFVICRSRGLGLEAGPVELCLRGQTWEGQAFAGCDELRVVETRRRGLRLGRRR